MSAALLLLTALLAAPGHPARGAAMPRVGVVTGVLHHKGCATTPSGAAVGVIGRDATARVDADGKFALYLPPGTYSLMITGPGLVPDQRVDDVAIVAGQTRDVGTVEVWPEERPPGCVGGAPAAPTQAVVVATAPETPAVDLPGAAVAPAPVGPEQIWVRGSGGTGAGQFGLQGNPARDDEDVLGPPSFAVGPQVSLWVLDALNARVQRFDARGHLTASFAVARHGDEPVVEADVAVSDDGHVFLFTAGEPPILTEHDASGRLLVGGALPPSFKGVDLLFTSRQRPIFLMQNGQGVRAELGWGGVRAEGPVPGLPAGNLFVHAERLDRWRASVKLSTADGRVKRSVQLHSRVPITGVRLVGVERRGDIVLAIDRVEGTDEATPRAEVLLLALDPQGHLAGAVSAPPGGRRFEFREFALMPDGVVVQMQSDTAEVRFVRWALRSVPRDLVAGEGLVRGHVVEAAHGTPAMVGVAKLHRAVPVGGDGSFELRLPAGTWTLSVRRGPPTAAADAAGVEIKVAVAPGATVDLGNLSVAPRPPRPATIVGGNGGAPSGGTGNETAAPGGPPVPGAGAASPGEAR